MKKIGNYLKLKLSRIHSKIVLFYIAFMIGPMLLMVFVFNVTIDVMKNSEAEYTINIISQMNENLVQVINKIESVTGRVSVDEQIITALHTEQPSSRLDTIKKGQAITAVIKANYSELPFVEAVNIIGSDGTLYGLSQSDVSLPAEYNYINTDWYRQMQQFGYSSILLPTHNLYDMMAENAAINVITYIREIRDEDAVIGYIMVDFETTIFDTYINSSYFKKGSSIIVIDSDTKKTIYHTNPENISSQYHASYLMRILENEMGYFVDTSHEGVEEIVAYTASGETGWTIIYTIPTAIAYQAIHNLTYLLQYLLMLSLPVAILLSVLVSGSLTRPIFALRDSMKKVEEGDLDLTIAVSTADEIGELSQSFNKMLEHIRKLIGEVYEKELHRKEAELGALQMQINPHFLYNTLQIMDIMAEEAEAYEISDACQALSTVFRYSISRKEEVTLKEELEHVKNYMFIQMLRFEDRLEVEYEIRPETLHLEIIRFIIQPIVENSIVHGMEQQEGMCRIKIMTEIIQDILTITITDTGVGMSAAQLEQFRYEINRESMQEDVTRKNYGGIAMRNVNQRIKLKYGGIYGLYIRSEKNKGTKVIINLPIRYKNEMGADDYESISSGR